MNEGELSSHKLDEMWSSFGTELVQVRDKNNTLCVCERERERVYVCVRERERER